MSTATLIRTLCHDGCLFPYEPVETSKPARRRLFLTLVANKERLDAGSATNLLCGRGPIEAAMTRWVSGGLIYYGGGRRYLSDLFPPPEEVWEVRVTEPRPQARLFGRFTEQDTLVLTSFHTRDHLGDRGSQAWSDAMSDCVKQWEDLDPKLPLLSGSSINDYVSENYDDFPIKRPPPRKTRSRRLRRQ